MSAPITHISKKKPFAPRLRFKEFSEDWKSNTLLGFDLKVIDGDRGTNYPNGDDFSSEGYCLFMSAKNVTKTGFSFEEKVFITKEKDELLRKGKLNRNDLVLTTRGSVGNIAFYNSKVELDNLRINSGMVLIRNENKDLDPNFIYSSFFSPKIDRQLKTIAFGSAQPQLTVKEINKFKFTIPTLPEQQKIASFLSAVDEKIQHLTRKKELLTDYKKGVMQQLFSGKLRFKDENGNAFPKWEEKKLGEITTLLKDGTHGTHKDFPEGNHYLLSAKNIINGSIKIDDTDRRISEEEYNSIYKNYKLLENDLLLTIVGTIGRVAIYKREQNIAFQRSVAFFRFKDQSPDFLFQLMNESKFQKQLDLRKVISAQPGIYLGDLAKIPAKLPCIDEQKKIANYLSNIDNKIENITKQITQTQTFKKGLLQQMFV